MCLPSSTSNGDTDILAQIWDIATRTITRAFEGHSADIVALALTHDGRLIASTSMDSSLRLWEFQTGRQVLKLTPPDALTCVAISRDDKFVAAGCLDKTVHVWSVPHGRHINQLRGPHRHEDSVYSVMFAPETESLRLVSGSLDCSIKMWELGEGEESARCLKTLADHRVSTNYLLSFLLRDSAD
jgi:WD40 repeat protein